MPKLVSRSKQIIDKLKAEGKVSYCNDPFNNPEHAKKMEKIMKDHRRKQGMSILAARNTIIC